jgi:GrpB-like predicted nucleotidyltransferase (UPF0157 family)
MSTTFRIQTIDDQLLATERSRLTRLLRHLVPDAEVLEVGSTAVPGVVGKGDLDLLVRVPAEAFASTRAVLDKALRRNAGQLSNDEYQGYHLDSPLDAAVQLTVKGSDYDDFERFLDALRADPKLVIAYNLLKKRYDGQPMELYRKAKQQFVERVLAG